MSEVNEVIKSFNHSRILRLVFNIKRNLSSKKLFERISIFVSFFLSMLFFNNSYSQSWSGWENLGTPSGGMSSEIVVAKNTDGRLETFTIGNDGALWHIWQVQKNGAWGPWSSLGSPAGIRLKGTTETNKIAAGVNNKSEIEVFAYGEDGSIWAISERGASGSSGWRDWVNRSMSPSDPQKGLIAKFNAPTKSILDISIGKNQDGRLELFIKNGDDNQIWHTWQDPGQPANSFWTGAWAKMDGPNNKNVGKFINGTGCDNKQIVLTFENHNSVNCVLWQKAQAQVNGGWGPWTSISYKEPISFDNASLAIGYNLDKRIEFFASLSLINFHMWQIPGCKNNFLNNDWANFGKPRTAGPSTGLIAAERSKAGILHLFTIAGDPNWGDQFQPVKNIILWNVYQTAPNNGWGKWEVVTDLPTPNGVTQLCANTNEDNRMEVYAVGFPPSNQANQPHQISVWHIYEKPK